MLAKNARASARVRQLSLSSSASSRSRQNSATDYGGYGTSPTNASMPARRTSQSANKSPSLPFHSSTNPSFSFEHGDPKRRPSGGTYSQPRGDFSAPTMGTSPVALLTISPHPDRASLPEVVAALAFEGDYGDENGNEQQDGQQPEQQRRRSSPDEVDPLEDTRKPPSGDMDGLHEGIEADAANQGGLNLMNAVHIRTARIVNTRVTKETLLSGEGMVCGDFFLRAGCANGEACQRIHVVGREHVWEPIVLAPELQTCWSRIPKHEEKKNGGSEPPVGPVDEDGVDTASNCANDDPLQDTTKERHASARNASSETAELYKLTALKYPGGFNFFAYDTSMTTYLRIPSDRVERTLGSEMFIGCYNEFGGNFKTQFSLCTDFDPAIDIPFEGGTSSGSSVVHTNMDGSTNRLSHTDSTLNATARSDLTTGGVADEEEDEIRAVDPRPRRGCPLGAQCTKIHCLEFNPVVTCKYSQTHMVLEEDVDSFAESRARYDDRHGVYASTYYYLPIDSSPQSGQQPTAAHQHHHRAQRASSAGQRAAQLVPQGYLTSTTVATFASLPEPPQLCPWYARLSSSVTSIVETAAQQYAHRSHHHRRRSSAASQAAQAAAAAAASKDAPPPAPPVASVELPRYYVRVYPQNCPANVRDDFEDVPIDAVLVTEGSNCFLRALRSLITKTTQSSVAASGKNSRKQSTVDAADANAAAAAAASKTNSPASTNLSPGRRVSIDRSSQRSRNNAPPLQLQIQVTPNDHVIVTPTTIKQPQHCAHFRLKQLCRKGPDCRFVHVMPGYPTTRFGGGGGGGRSPQEEHLGGGGSRRNTRAQLSTVSPTIQPQQQRGNNSRENSHCGSLNLGSGAATHQGGGMGSAGRQHSNSGGVSAMPSFPHNNHSRQHSAVSQDSSGHSGHHYYNENPQQGYQQPQRYMDPARSHDNSSYASSSHHQTGSPVAGSGYQQPTDWYTGGGQHHGYSEYPPYGHHHHHNQQLPQHPQNHFSVPQSVNPPGVLAASNRPVPIDATSGSPSETPLTVSPTRSPTSRRTNDPYKFA